MNKVDKGYQIIFDAKNPLLASEIAELFGEKNIHSILYYLYNKGEIKRSDSYYGYKYCIDDIERKLINEETDKRKKIYSIIREGLIEGMTKKFGVMEKGMKTNGNMSKTLKVIQNSKRPLTSTEISQCLGEKLNIITARLCYFYKKGIINRTEDIPYKYYANNYTHLKTIQTETKKHESISDKVLEVINNAEMPLRASEVGDRIDENPSNICTTLSKLYKSGKIKRHDLSNVYKYYSTNFDLQAYLGVTDSSVQNAQTVHVTIEIIVKAYQRVVAENQNLVSEKEELGINCVNLNLENGKLSSKNQELNKQLTMALSKIEKLEEDLLTERERSAQYNEMLLNNSIPVHFTARERSFLGD